MAGVGLLREGEGPDLVAGVCSPGGLRGGEARIMNPLQILLILDGTDIHATEHAEGRERSTR